MSKEKDAFEAWCVKDDEFCIHRYDGSDEYSDDYTQCAWLAWQAAKAQAVPEGFVLVPKEPYAYLIKHKLWQKDSDPEIFLAVDFLSDDGVEKDELTVCIPLYLGDDETQESK